MLPLLEERFDALGRHARIRPLGAVPAPRRLDTGGACGRRRGRDGARGLRQGSHRGELARRVGRAQAGAPRAGGDGHCDARGTSARARKGLGRGTSSAACAGRAGPRRRRGLSRGTLSDVCSPRALHTHARGRRTLTTSPRKPSCSAAVRASTPRSRTSSTPSRAASRRRDPGPAPVGDARLHPDPAPGPPLRAADPRRGAPLHPGESDTHADVGRARRAGRGDRRVRSRAPAGAPNRSGRLRPVGHVDHAVDASVLASENLRGDASSGNSRGPALRVSGNTNRCSPSTRPSSSIARTSISLPLT